MRILKVLFEKFTYPINKKAGDWDDAVNIPDIAEIITDDDKEKENPLCSDFWKYSVFNKSNNAYIPDSKTVIRCYEQNSVENM